jgi:hypothetical protein
MTVASSSHRVWLPKRGHFVHFHHRRTMRRRAPQHLRRFHFPLRYYEHVPFGVPATTLPVDSTGNATVSCPMDGNDTYGDCGEAMAAHGDNIWTYGQGQPGFTESSFTTAALVAQYEKVSGGDNGLDESEVVNDIWSVGIAGNPQAVIVDSLDIDITNVPLVQFAIDQFYLACMGWDVPDAFIQEFNTGTVWPDAMTPDPANGHYVPLADIAGPATVQSGYSGSLSGFYRLWTWGTWCWVSPAFVASVEPGQCFIAFSPRQFNPATGYDSKGRHITAQAALWQSCGGNPIPAAVINAFPPPTGPTPTPTPVPTPTPTPIPTPTPVPVPTPTPTPTPPSRLCMVLAEMIAKALAQGRTRYAQLLTQLSMRLGCSPLSATPAYCNIDWNTLLQELATGLVDAEKVVALIETFLSAA